MFDVAVRFLCRLACQNNKATLSYRFSSGVRSIKCCWLLFSDDRYHSLVASEIAFRSFDRSTEAVLQSIKDDVMCSLIDTYAQLTSPCSKDNRIPPPSHMHQWGTVRRSTLRLHLWREARRKRKIFLKLSGSSFISRRVHFSQTKTKKLTNEKKSKEL